MPATPLASTFSRADTRATGSLSKATTGPHPSLAAAMARIPEPVPASTSGPREPRRRPRLPRSLVLQQRQGAPGGGMQTGAEAQPGVDDHVHQRRARPAPARARLPRRADPHLADRRWGGSGPSSRPPSHAARLARSSRTRPAAAQLGGQQRQHLVVGGHLLGADGIEDQRGLRTPAGPASRRPPPRTGPAGP